MEMNAKKKRPMMNEKKLSVTYLGRCILDGFDLAQPTVKDLEMKTASEVQLILKNLELLRDKLGREPTKEEVRNMLTDLLGCVPMPGTMTLHRNDWSIGRFSEDNFSENRNRFFVLSGTVSTGPESAIGAIIYVQRGPDPTSRWEVHSDMWPKDWGWY